MKEAELIQAVISWITLSYTASQWWLTVTTALIVATYFAARHIPGWLFGVVLLLYVLTSMSAVFEVTIYGDMAQNYGKRLAEIRAASHVSPSQVEPGSAITSFNGLVNYAVFILGTFSAAAFSFIHWRSARKTTNP